MYSPEKIFLRCPEVWKEHVFLEWTIRDANLKIGYLLHLISPLELIQLERARDELASTGTSLVLYKQLKNIYYIDPLLVNFVLNCLKLPFAVNQDEINQDYIILLELLIKQNDVIKHAITSKASCNESQAENKDTSTLDIYDTIIEIIQLGLVSDLTLLNYKDLLTYRQLDFYAKKANNFHKKRMLQFYEPFIHGLSMAFAKKEDKIPDFRKLLFVETEDRQISKYEKNRKIWFADRWDDEEFVKTRSEELGLEAELFFPYEISEELN